MLDELLRHGWEIVNVVKARNGHSQEDTDGTA